MTTKPKDSKLNTKQEHFLIYFSSQTGTKNTSFLTFHSLLSKGRTHFFLTKSFILKFTRHPLLTKF